MTDYKKIRYYILIKCIDMRGQLRAASSGKRGFIKKRRDSKASPHHGFQRKNTKRKQNNAQYEGICGDFDSASASRGLK